MLIVVINESIKKSLTKSRRTLSKYLPQHGSTVWMGDLSQKGLIALFKELKQQSTRHTAIIGYKLLTRNSFKILFKVGSMSKFSEDGQFFFKKSTKGTKSNPDTEVTIIELIGQLALLAGFFHDYGKCNNAFQQKLRNGYQGHNFEPIRHDLIGAIIIEEYTKNGKIGSLAECFSINKIEIVPVEYFDEIKIDSFIANILSFSNETNIEKMLISILKWLVLTHHFMPSFETLDQYCSSFDKSYKWYSHIQHFKADMSISSKDVRTLNVGQLVGGDYKKNVLNCLRRIQYIMDNLSESSKNYFLKNGPLIARVYLRPVLVHSDCLSSSYYNSFSENISGTPIADKIWANKRSPDCGGDLLDMHLLKVGKQAGRLVEVIGNLSENNFDLTKDYQVIPSKDIRQILGLDNIKDDRFIWQKTAFDKYYETFNGLENFGLFSIILAGTGSGKTRGGLGLMAAVGENVRFSLLLGLRDLALQSTKAYLDFGLSIDSIITAVGGPIKSVTVENASKYLQNHDGSENKGESRYLDDFDLYCTNNVSQPDEFINSIILDEYAADLESVDYYSDKDKQLIYKAITVATTDHYMPIVSGIKNNASSLLLRIASSDLILDEIDNYSYSDYYMLSKLVYLYGFFGRKIFLMSATIAADIVFELYSSYYAGYECFVNMHNIKVPEIYFGAVSNKIDPFILKNKDSQAVRESYLEYVETFCKKTSSKNKLGLLAVPEVCFKDSMQDQYECILASCFTLHSKHGLRLEDGIKYSVGFVRFNTVKNSQLFAEYVAENKRNEKQILLVVCYHSNFPFLVKNYISEKLQEFLNRKKKDYAPFHHALVKDHPLILNKNQDVVDIVIIISTTSILETGRDIDADWCIAEPCGGKSAVQTDGRVRRHRGPIEDSSEPNFLLLDRPLKKIEVSKSTDLAWAYPGVETTDNRRKLFEMIEINSTSIRSNIPKRNSIKYLIYTQDVLPIKEWAINLTPYYCLTHINKLDYSKCRLIYIEQEEYNKYLKVFKAVIQSSHVFNKVGVTTHDVVYSFRNSKNDIRRDVELIIDTAEEHPNTCFQRMNDQTKVLFKLKSSLASSDAYLLQFNGYLKYLSATLENHNIVKGTTRYELLNGISIKMYEGLTDKSVLEYSFQTGLNILD